MALNNEQSTDESHGLETSRRDELYTFLFLAIFLAPILAVLIVGGYGFLVWMFQLILGPPGA